MTEELKVTSPEEYAEKAKAARASEDRGFLHRLKKTGAVVRLRRADMEGLAMVGAIPMSLVTAAQGQLQAAQDETPQAPTPEQVEQGNRSLVFMRQTVAENCLEPPIGFDEAGVISFMGKDGKAAARVDKDDFLEMFEVITGQEGADGLKSFRSGGGNRAQRRASASQSRRGKVRPEPVLATTRK